MAGQSRFVIVGAGLAGAKAAEALREEGFDGQLLLIGDEPEPPYERPPLSKEFLRRETEDLPVVHPGSFYRDNDIELLTAARVMHIDPGAEELLLEGDRRIGYDRLLIATGSVPRRLEFKGVGLEGVHYLRTVGDSRQIAERIAHGGRVVVVGSGWIGAEVAASARQKGCEVTMLEMASLPLERVLGPEVGRVYRDMHRAEGVEFLPETTVDRLEGEGAVSTVVTRDGARIEADLVIVGIGVRPRSGLAEAAGLPVENGVLVDERLETGATGVFAAGDVANVLHPFYGRRVRVEHWAAAVNHGPIAARAMLGKETAYAEIPYFFSDQYESGMEYTGFATDWDEVVFRGDVEARKFIAFWLHDGRVVAGMNMNVWDVSEEIRELIRGRQKVDARRLADPDVDLGALSAREGAAA